MKTNKKPELSGCCLCGDAVYEVTAKPVKFFLCHCRDCQYVSGGSGSPFVLVPLAALNIEQQLGAYKKTTDAGNTATRCFCEKCGTHVYSTIDNKADWAFIKAGTLDDASDLRLDAQFWCASAQPWLQLNNSVPHFEQEL